MKNRILRYGGTWGSSRSAEVSDPMATTPARERVSHLRRSLETLAIQHPVASVAAALCVGVLVGWFIKRR